jgi:putative pyruvate formate lyase activating enzyme
MSPHKAVNDAPWNSRVRMGRALAHRAHCTLCEHRCGADRSAGERGPCKAGPDARVFRHRVEYGEELELVPSHLFYLSGCDLRCVFCIAGLNAFDPARGRPLSSEFFNEAVAWGRAQGARNIQWVGGEPTVHLPAILEVMARCPDLPPVVWKSDFHSTPEAYELLEGVVDTYVADFKFGNDHCARRLAGVSDYVRIVTRNLKIAAGQGRLIVRHLLLPGHAECCYRPVAEWMCANLPAAAFSIREGYLPSWRAARFAELTAPLPASAGRAAHELAAGLGLAVIQ